MSTPAYTEQALGKRGSEIIDDTSAHTGDWVAMIVVNDAEIAADGLTSNITNEDGLEGITLTAGLVVYGHITSIDLASGVVQMINR